MEKFTQKYCLVAFLEDVAERHQYHYSSWPLHTTLADVFAVPLTTQELLQLLTNCIPVLHSVKTKAEDDRFFGPEKQVRVTLLHKTKEITALHEDIITELKKAGAVFNDPQYTLDGFLPHVTVQRHARVQAGDDVHIQSIGLVDMFPDGDGHERKVLKTWQLA